MSTTEVSRIVDTIRRHHYWADNEARLQGALTEVLEAEGFTVDREVALASAPRPIPNSDRSPGRIDLTVGRVGIEVKIDGSTSALIRQLHRYAKTGRFDALVVVTTRAKHRHVPENVAGIPVRVVQVGAGL